MESDVFRLHFSFHVLILFGHHVLNTLENELISIFFFDFRFCLDTPSGPVQATQKLSEKYLKITKSLLLFVFIVLNGP